LTAGGLPKTSSGKVQRRACKKALQDGELQTVGQVTFEDEE
jgi:acyl-coenzyme A synthetase/AMP-(fatty) acid ligase